jgi:PAS domain S-box-containing protein
VRSYLVLAGIMRKRSSSNLGMWLRYFSWPMALIGIVIIKSVLAIAVKPGSFLLSYSGISYFLLLLLATSFAVRNGIQNTLGSRPFWTFLAIGYGLWALDQWIFLYYELGLHIEVPENSIADPVLFLHIAPFMAAVAILPHRNVSERRIYRTILNSLSLLFFWGFLYGYTVFPYQYLFSSARSPSYAFRFDILYLLENLALVLVVGILSLRVEAPWKSIYLHLLGATSLYTLSSAATNLAIDSGGYVNGKLYGLGLTASVCWFVWIPLRARQVPGAVVKATRSDGSRGSHASAWAMLAVLMISIPMVGELFQRNENTGMRTLRLLVATVAIVGLASAAYIKEFLARRGLASRVGVANDRLRLAMDSARSVAWDWDVRSGRDQWFGDLKTIFGIPSDTYVGHVEDFRRRVHPDDQSQVWKAVSNAMHGHQPYAAEFRILWADGTVRWVDAKGKFYYSRDGRPERMLGMAVDITERKQAEEALSRATRRAIEAEEREHNRIARDLHEDIGQRLALSAIEIDKLKTDFPNQTQEIRSRMDAVWQQTLEILSDVKASAHELHSPRLEYLGIAEVMRCFCKEFGDRKKVAIDFTSRGLPSLVPPDVSICLFRVLQEALHNGVEHSGVRDFEVQLWGISDEIHLMVRDAGAGFDLEAARKGQGLGLIRMEERLKLVKGTFSIESQPKSGTTVQARVSLSSGSDSMRAAG